MDVCRSYDHPDDGLAKAIICEVEKIRSSQLLIVPPRGGQYDWKSRYYKLPTEGRGILFFAAKSSGYHLYIALSSEPEITYPMYEIVIRAGMNLESVIRRSVLGGSFEDLCIVPGVVTDSNFENMNQYWLSIDVETQVIQVGRGKQMDLASVFFVYKDLDFIGKTQYIAFSSWKEHVTYSDISVASMGSESSDSTLKQLWNLSTVEILPNLPSMTIQPMEANFDWSRHYKLPSKGQGCVLFSAEASNDVHVAISPSATTMYPSYHIVIGGRNNTLSRISKVITGTTVRDADFLCCVMTGLIKDSKQLWVLIDAETQLIQVGRGSQPDLASVICVQGYPFSQGSSICLLQFLEQTSDVFQHFSSFLTHSKSGNCSRADVFEHEGA